MNLKLYTLFVFTLLSSFSLFSQDKIIQSKELKVTVDTSFPLIKNYSFKGETNSLLGNIAAKKEIAINNHLFTPKTTSKVTGNSITYQMEFDSIDVIIETKIEVIENVVDFKITKINEIGDFKVNYISIPDHQLLTVSSQDKRASFAGSRMFTAIDGSKGDVYQRITKKTKLDSVPQGFLYAIVSNQKVAASIWSNAVQENNDDKRILKNTFQKNGTKYTSLYSGYWTYRARRINTPSELPHVKLVFTKDVNNDRTIDWQDGAIAHRKIMNNPYGTERVKEWVVYRIPMNFASQATNPFSMSLDETKRIFLNTDGLGQFVILKGYGGEGHDSNHPDYGYIGKRQGGAKELNLICDQSDAYNADIGVHINGTESYPEARMFSEDLVAKNRPGWNWLDASYYIDKRNDAIDNKRYKRLKSLKTQVPNLDFIYLDVWYNRGSWDSRKVASEINSLDLILATEFPMDLEYNAVWNHWAVDYKYGGKTIKGYNSKIARFIRNHQKDTWIAKHPLLGGAEMIDFEGWQGRIDYNQCIDITFTTNLPAKFLQHFPIKKWNKNTIVHEGNVRVSDKSGRRIITKNGVEIYNPEAYLIPWNPIKEDKLYHWNNKGGSTSWQLPISWKHLNKVFVYKLSDQGKSLVNEVDVNNNSITLNVKSKTPYVIYASKQTVEKTMNWGEGTFVENGGFNSGNTQKWNAKGENISVVRDSLGQYELTFRKSNVKSSVSQKIKTLSKGYYSAEAYVETAKNRKVSLHIEGKNKTFSNYTTSSMWENFIAADSKHGTNMQRMYTFFEIDKFKDNVTLNLEVEAGDTTVTIDDIRIVKMAKRTKVDSLYFYENFEQLPNGIYPFVKGSAGGANDPRVHLAEKHSPYTQKGWNGKPVDDVLNGDWSLKLHENVSGIIVQTIPQNLRFVAGKKYKVMFSYQAESNDYAFILGDNKKVVFETKIDKMTDTQVFEFIFTASATGNSWFGIKKINKKTSDFIIDELKVKCIN